MAFMLEVDQLIPPLRAQQPQLEIEKAFSLICSYLKEIGIFYTTNTLRGKIQLFFTVPLEIDGQNMHRWTFNLREGSLRQSVLLLPGKRAPPNLPIGIIKYLLRAMKFINQVANLKWFNIFLHPYTGQIRLKSQGNPINTTSSALLSIFKEKVTITSLRANEFMPLFLYYANRIPPSLLINSLPSVFHLVFLNEEQGEFKLFAQTKELLFLREFKIDESVCAQRRKVRPLQEDQMEFIQQVRDKHASLQQKQLKGITLWSTPPPLSEPIIHKNAADNLSMITTSQCASFMFNTITISKEDKKSEKLISDSYYKKDIVLTAMDIEFTYCSSRNFQEQIIDDQAQLQSSKALDQNRIRQKVAIKMPANKLNVQARQKLRWQKHILSNLRGTRQNIYFPKYYHTVQEHFDVRVGIIMDYIDGQTLDKMHRSRQTASVITFLALAQKIAQALRFLNRHSIAHLDLSPNNIMVDRQNRVKIIDFGEAYSANTHERYVKRHQCYVHRPGQTYPFFPPEIHRKTQGFNTKQDIYSLGVILFYIFFGKYPLTSSERQLEILYKKGTYQERLFFIPEANADLGPVELYDTMAALVLAMLEPKENRRPHATWAHLLLDKLLQAVTI